MKFIIDDEVVLSRPLEGPLAAHITAFAKWVSEQGYGRCSRCRQVLVAARFSQWLGQHAVSVHSVSSEHQARYLRSRPRHVQIRSGDAAALRHFMDFLRRQGAVPVEKIPLRPANPDRAGRTSIRALLTLSLEGKFKRYRPGDQLLGFLNNL